MMSPEEKERRRKEHFAIADKRKFLIEKYISADNDGNKELAKKLFREMTNLTPRMCEHDRHWSSTCMACDQIHKEVFPEFYSTCKKCAGMFDPDALNDKGNCDSCQYDLDNP